MSDSLSSRHIPWLDGWRGLAIALVLLEHFAGLPTGRLGVEVFFVLSGLLISRILFVQRVPLRTFYRRRVARIFPVFYLYIAAMVLLGGLVGVRIDWESVGWTALFLRSYFGGHIWEDPLAFGNLWSLNVEEHAYVLLSILALVASTGREQIARWLLSALALSPVVVHAYFRLFPETDGGTPFVLRTEVAIFPMLLSAAILLWVQARRLEVRAWIVVCILLLTLLAATIDAVGIARGGTALRFLVLPALLALSINLLDRAPGAVKSLLSSRWLTWLGACSFSIYLWHYPFFVFMNRGDWQFGKLAAFVCAIGVGALSFYCFERPMRTLLRGVDAKLPKSAVPNIA